jgi:hypothetical protein
LRYKLTRLGKKKKINCVLIKIEFFTTIRRCAVESTEKRLYLLCKYTKQTYANLPNSGVYTKVCSAFMSFVEPESKTLININIKN